MTEAMGHGVNQRKAIQMTPDEVDAFLAERRNMTMCSLSADGSIHAIGVVHRGSRSAVEFAGNPDFIDGRIEMFGNRFLANVGNQVPASRP